MSCNGLVGLRGRTENLPTFGTGVFKTRPKLLFRSLRSQGSTASCEMLQHERFEHETAAPASWPKRLSTLVGTLVRNHGIEERKRPP